MDALVEIEYNLTKGADFEVHVRYTEQEEGVSDVPLHGSVCQSSVGVSSSSKLNMTWRGV